MDKNQEQKPARPWDIFNRNQEKLVGDLKKQRLSICHQCDRLIGKLNICKECGCQMDLKTSLPHAECPLKKWVAVNVSFKEEL